MEWHRAVDLAKDVRLLLAPCCVWVEIAGSIRRMRYEINDIEIIAVPKQDPFNQLDLRVIQLLDQRLLLPGEPSKGMKKPPMGQKYKRLRVPADPEPIQLDLFSVLPPADFGIIFCIRTGSAEFSHWIVTEALRRSYKVKDGQLFRIHRDEQPWRFEHIPCPEEWDLFQALGIPWVEPRDRDPGLFPAITMPSVALGLASPGRSPTILGSISTAVNQSINQSELIDNQSINQSINGSGS
jgi:DNA polymerase/3'-5' exonuclease PolX